MLVRVSLLARTCLVILGGGRAGPVKNSASLVSGCTSRPLICSNWPGLPTVPFCLFFSATCRRYLRGGTVAAAWE